MYQRIEANCTFEINKNSYFKTFLIRSSKTNKNYEQVLEFVALFLKHIKPNEESHSPVKSKQVIPFVFLFPLKK